MILKGMMMGKTMKLVSQVCSGMSQRSKAFDCSDTLYLLKGASRYLRLYLMMDVKQC